MRRRTVLLSVATAYGIAKQSGRPVAITTTSGTAAANLMPAWYLPARFGPDAGVADGQPVGVGRGERDQFGTLYGVEFPFAGERWVWSLVPRKRTFPYHAEHLLVAGVADIKEAQQGSC